VTKIIIYLRNLKRHGDRMSKILILVLLFLIKFSPVFSQKLNITVEELLTIGGDEDLPVEYLFVAPQKIFTDSQDNLYLRDVTSTMGFLSKEIRKYSPEGKYIATIGQKGDGPGEVRCITCFCVNQNDEILVYDAMNKRLTLFNNNCIDYKILKPPLNIYLKPKYILPFPDDRYLVVNHVSLHNINYEIFYIYDQEFTKITEKFGDPNDIWDFSEALLRLRRGFINFAFFDSTKFFLAPEFYAGIVYNLQKYEDKWITKRIRGNKPKLRPFKQIPRSRSGKSKKPNLNFGERGKKYTYLINNQSIGLYPYKEEYIIHFSIQDNDDGKYHFISELFSSSGEYLGYNVLKKYESLSYKKRKIIGTSKDGSYFLTENNNDIPAIKKISIKIDND
jgi:hypothetical protein